MNEFMNWMLLTFRKERNIIAASIVLGFAVTFCALYIIASYTDTVQAGISSKVLRFHILANSDSESDQELKLALRDALFCEYEELGDMQSRNESENFLSRRLSEIEEFSESFISEKGYAYGVSVELVNESFPTRAYGDLAFPAGDYEALRVTIGSGEGKNFWCVMFPPLCFIDVAKNEVTDETKSSLKQVLDEDSFELIDKDNAKPDIKLKFKLVEFWNSFEYRFK